MSQSAHRALPGNVPARNVPDDVPGALASSRPNRIASTDAAPDERGITTAEYAVGTAAGAGLAGLLYQLLTSEFGEQLLRALFEHVLRLLGIG